MARVHDRGACRHDADRPTKSLTHDQGTRKEGDLDRQGGSGQGIESDREEDFYSRVKEEK